MLRRQMHPERASFPSDVSGKSRDMCISANSMLTPAGELPSNSAAWRHPDAAVKVTWRFDIRRIALARHPASKSSVLGIQLNLHGPPCKAHLRTVLWRPFFLIETSPRLCRRTALTRDIVFRSVNSTHASIGRIMSLQSPKGRRIGAGPL